MIPERAPAADEDREPPVLAYAARIAGDRARTRIVLDLDRKPVFEVRYLEKPDRIVVDLPATAFAFPVEDLKARGLFKDVRYGAVGARSARIVLTTERPAQLALAEVQADEAGKGFRLVLDAEMVKRGVFDDLVKRQAWSGGRVVVDVPASDAAARGDRPGTSSPVPGNTFVIAIDAGHGGIDNGAIASETKTPEKDITLAFAKALQRRLAREPGIFAFLTREGDEFLSLSERVTIARQHHANLFVSLHADKLRQDNIRGATVYTISDKASDKMAAELAERENLADAIGGVDLAAEPAEVTDILLDFTRRETQAFSVAMAEQVVSSFDGQVALINNPHRFAGFRVLQAHDVPSILLELGFLSNKDDEKVLLDESWREKIAELLTAAIRRYREPVLANGG
ncbi:N-acetylmuramoyl-L-alanine amidase [Ciceribacter thiooxidans]|uniref:N-acetylmuramoyl-L-alanine amidase n=1 Tax=Ciceribacter thiooxidans TaxID=1969821 RepID=A0ABV7IAK6_9HYPH|nr:N-acetylmuramoyl-L-alanine amidase [Ciceribacter thiooxidans]